MADARCCLARMGLFADFRAVREASIADAGGGCDQHGMGQGYALLWSTRADAYLVDATRKKIAALYNALEGAIVGDLKGWLMTRGMRCILSSLLHNKGYWPNNFL